MKTQYRSGNDEARPFFSVVMVTHNQASFVPAALDALFNQTYSDRFQIVVSDDASTDGTEDLIKRAAKMAPVHIEMTVLAGRKRIGALRNFNRALRYCRGRFVVIADGDDVSALSRLEILSAEIGRGTKSLYISDVVELETGKARAGAAALKRESFGAEKLKGPRATWPILGAGFTFDAALLEREPGVNPFYATNHNADHAIFWRAMAANGCKTIDKALVRYRDHHDGISLRRAEANARDRGDWASAYDLHLRRSCNRIGNLAYAADQFLTSQSLTSWRVTRDHALRHAKALVRLLSCLEDRNSDELRRLQRWCENTLEKVSKTVRGDASFASAFDARDMLLWSALSEGGLLDTASLRRFLSVRGPKVGTDMQFGKSLLCLRKQIGSARERILSDHGQLREALAPKIVGGIISYHGNDLPVSLRAIQGLPKRDFLVAAQLVQAAKIDPDHYSGIKSMLMNDQVGKRRAFALLAGGRLAALGLKSLGWIDRIKIAVAPAGPPKRRPH